MEGVGARLGRSSSRYGTTTVFSGPVRKWKKDWIPITPSSSSSSSSNPSSSSSIANGHGGSHSNSNGSSSVSHLRLFKWAPVSQSTNNKENNNINNNLNNNNNNNVNNGSVNGDCSPSKVEDDAVLDEEPPRRKFKYIPIAMLEEQKKEAEENTDDEGKLADADESTAEPASKSDGHDEKPDINDVPMEETQDADENQTAPGRQDLNESLDLSLGLTSLEEERDSDSKTEPTRDAEQERPNSGSGAA